MDESSSGTTSVPSTGRCAHAALSVGNSVDRRGETEVGFIEIDVNPKQGLSAASATKGPERGWAAALFSYSFWELLTEEYMLLVQLCRLSVVLSLNRLDMRAASAWS